MFTEMVDCSDDELRKLQRVFLVRDTIEIMDSLTDEVYSHLNRLSSKIQMFFDLVEKTNLTTEEREIIDRIKRNKSFIYDDIARITDYYSDIKTELSYLNPSGE